MVTCSSWTWRKPTTGFPGSTYSLCWRQWASPLFCKWITTLYQDLKAEVIVNNGKIKEFAIGQGLCQGNPMSPLLFNFAANLILVACQVKLKAFADDTVCGVANKEDDAMEQGLLSDLVDRIGKWRYKRLDLAAKAQALNVFVYSKIWYVAHILPFSAAFEKKLHAWKRKEASGSYQLRTTQDASGGNLSCQA
ncbi:hypothetical protein DSO57_1007306 [Entomophthora muscae]|uniref:Uncharacterized protein n=1 Tax=Entomophthora muscae TaxID=34485 RepID=A0ACC2RM73_9FUNG|nr:hypothetical protein DSO57_1007306 [Entomophthora muscae]